MDGPWRPQQLITSPWSFLVDSIMSNNSTNITTAAEEETGVFAKHKKSTAASQNDNHGSGSESSGTAKMSILARFLIFAFIPSFTGLAGLGISYLQSIMQRRRGDSKEVNEVNFDQDFVTPFLLALALVIVLGFQTNGFSMNSGDKRRGAFVWPKARTVKRVRRERVVVDDDDDGDDKKEQ